MLQVQATDLVGDLGRPGELPGFHAAIEHFAEKARGLVDVAGERPGDAHHPERLIPHALG